MSTTAERIQNKKGQELLAEISTLTTFVGLLKGRDSIYFTENVIMPNVKRMAEWAMQNDVDFVAADTLGFWQLAFANTKNEMTADPDAPYFADERAAFRRRVGAMSVAQLKLACKTETGFAEQYDALQKAENSNVGLNLKGF